MTLETKLFGTVDYQPEEVITFPAGLPGFESEHKFIFLPIAGGSDTMLCLQSIKTPYLSFVVMDPFCLDPSYAPTLSNDDLQALKVKQVEDLCFYVLCMLKKPVATSTANLKCPIALNPSLQTAYQVFVDSDAYHMHHPLSEFTGNKEK